MENNETLPSDSTEGTRGQVPESAAHVWWWRGALLTAIIAATIATVWLSAQGRPQPGFGQMVASPANFVATTTTATPNILANTPTPVTFSISITTPTLNPTTVQLQRVDVSGKLLYSLSRMYDDGTHGDARTGDKLFTVAITVNEPAVGKSYFRVGAAFTGNTQNVWSPSTAMDVDPFKLPPDPGEAGKETLAGIDSNSNGVRDDIDRYIAYQYRTSAKVRAALTQYALGLQNLEIATSRIDIQEDWKAALAGARCLRYLDGTEKGNQDERLIRVAYLNTDARIRAFYKASDYPPPVDVAAALSALPQDPRSNCVFNPDSLPN